MSKNFFYFIYKIRSTGGAHELLQFDREDANPFEAEEISSDDKDHKEKKMFKE